MAYIKTNWVNGDVSETTPLSADNLNKMEQGIYDANLGANLFKINDGYSIRSDDTNLGLESVNMMYNASITGNYSFGFGNGAIVQSNYAMGFGYAAFLTAHYAFGEGLYPTVTGTAGHAEGEYTEANGYASHAEGGYTEANAYYSHAEGNQTIAQNECSHAAGQNNVGTSTETIHETGIGTASYDRKNAFEIYKNGRIRAPELTLALHDDDKSLTTKEYVVNEITIGIGSIIPLINSKLESTTAGEPTGSSAITNIVKISQADYDQAVIDGTLNSTTAYIIE